MNKTKTNITRRNLTKICINKVCISVLTNTKRHRVPTMITIILQMNCKRSLNNWLKYNAQETIFKMRFSTNILLETMFSRFWKKWLSNRKEHYGLQVKGQFRSLGIKNKQIMGRKKGISIRLSLILN